MPGLCLRGWLLAVPQIQSRWLNGLMHTGGRDSCLMYNRASGKAREHDLLKSVHADPEHSLPRSKRQPHPSSWLAACCLSYVSTTDSTDFKTLNCYLCSFSDLETNQKLFGASPSLGFSFPGVCLSRLSAPTIMWPVEDVVLKSRHLRQSCGALLTSHLRERLHQQHRLQCL